MAQGQPELSFAWRVGLLTVLLACVAATLHAQVPSWSERLAQSTTARQAGDHERAEALLVDALADAQAAFGPTDTRVATTLNALASLYEATGRAEAAESLYVRSLSIIEAALGPGHLEVATTLNALGTLYLAEGRFAEAEPILARSLAVYQSLPGGWPRASATVLNNLAVAQENLGKLAAAESTYTASIRLKERVQGAHDPALAAPLSNLAALHQRRRDFRVAESLYARALEIQERAHGADHPDLIPTLVNIALTYERLGIPDSAVTAYERASVLYQTNELERDLLYATVAANLGTIHLSREQYDQAEQHLLEALDIYEAALGEASGEVLRMLDLYAYVLRNTGREDEARSVIRRPTWIHPVHGRLNANAGDPEDPAGCHPDPARHRPVGRRLLLGHAQLPGGHAQADGRRAGGSRDGPHPSGCAARAPRTAVARRGQPGTQT
jgi:tetratricopeptide (TPR) repeat protein